MAVVAACALAACSDDSTAETEAVGWAEPGWMAEKRQSDEEFVAAMSTCLTEAGWDVEVAADGTYSHEGQGEATVRAFNNAVSACSDKHGSREAPTREGVETLYDRALDTAACLEAAGYDVSDPPSLEAYVEDVLERSPDIWIPFQEVLDSTEFTNDAEYQALYARCPQDGPSASLSF